MVILIIVVITKMILTLMNKEIIFLNEEKSIE